jgi:DNA polymerase-3 subunit delta
MAKEISKDKTHRFEDILSGLGKGIVSPLYLLMGEEPYYSDIITEEIIKNSLTLQERDFNLLILYGPDTNPVKVIEASRRYPVMAARQVVIVKEAQLMADIKGLEIYFRNPFPSTVLVISLTGKTVDKRGAFYKAALENAVVLESTQLKDYQVLPWIESYIKKRGKRIEPDAAVLLADHCGVELRKLVQELEKLINHLSEDEEVITPLTVEENTGISREYNTFELVKAVSMKDNTKAFKIACHFGDSPKQYPNVMTFAALFSHFARVLKYHAIVRKNRNAGKYELMKATGTWESALRELESSARNYSMIKCMEVISLIRKYDYMSKSNDRGEADDGELLMELVHKIMN